MNNILDNSIDILIICFGISLIICLPILCFNFREEHNEQQCVEFYKKTNYITKACEKYNDKLEALNE